MESFNTAAGFMDDLFDFSSDIGEEDEEESVKNRSNKRPRKALPSFNANCHGSAPFDAVFGPDPDDTTPPFPESAEEELEWLSNKDAFPALESFVDILSNPLSKHQRLDSIMENSNSSSTSSSTTSSTLTITNSNSSIIPTCYGILCVPVRARSKGRRKVRRDLQSENTFWSVRQESSTRKRKNMAAKVSMGRKCQHCGAEKTPQWRAGPMGPKTLCNACGVRYKSGRLVPEYRPASSPTFSMELHSNSHRKVMEMRRQKQMMGMSDSGKGIVKSVDKG